MRRCRRGEQLGFVLVLGSLLGLRSPAAAAEIRWETSVDCDPRARVSTQIETLLERSLPSVDTIDFEARVERAEPAGFRLTFVGIERGRDERRSRTLSSGTCDELAEAAAVAMTLAIRSTEYVPDATGAAKPPHRERGLAPPAANAPNDPTEDHPGAPRPSPRRAETPAHVRPFLGAHLLADVGALPAASPGAGLGFGLSWKALRAEAGFAFFVPSTEETSAGGGGRFSLAAGIFGLCLEPSAAEVRPLVCASFELGQLTGEGVGVARSRSGTATWTALKVDGGLAVRVAASLSLLARVGVARPFSRPDFVLGGAEVVFRPSALAARGGIGVEYSW